MFIIQYVVFKNSRIDKSVNSLFALKFIDFGSQREHLVRKGETLLKVFTPFGHIRYDTQLYPKNT